jgi:pimeloyl-ACP methyl ester carboxylesterase
MVEVPGDVPAAVVRAPAGRRTRTVFLPGVCSNAYAYLYGFPEAARAAGGVVALDGDQPCNGAFRTFTTDAARQHARIDAALAAAGITDVPGGVTLVGYSRGATIAELLSLQWPDRYPRLVLIGSPRDPNLDRLTRAQAVATMSCSLDVPARMKTGAKRLAARGQRAAYFEMPGCTHGQLAEGDRVFSEVFAWLEGTDPD